MAYRYAPDLQLDTFNPVVGDVEGRKHLNMGPVASTTGLSIPAETHPTTNPRIVLLEGDRVCAHGKLPTVHQRGWDESRNEWYKQDESHGV